MDSDDRDYYRRRSNIEMKRADEANTIEAASIHRSLAASYRRLSDGQPAIEPEVQVIPLIETQQ